MGRNDSQGFLSRDQVFKVNPQAMGEQKQVQIGANNLELSKMKREEFKKAVYGLATGQLKNRTNTKGELSADAQGSFNKDKKAPWGVSISDHTFFHNPSSVPEPTPETPATVFSQPDKIEPTIIPEPEKPAPVFNDKLKDEQLGMVRPITKDYELNLDAFNNFALGSGKLDDYRNFLPDGSKGNIDFSKYLNSLPPEQQKQLADTYTKLNDPNYRKALGALDFQTGTDGTRMSSASRERLTNAYNDPNNAAGKFARENGLKLDEDGMQRMLGYERYNETNSLFEAGAKHYGVDSNGLVNPYKKENHTKGKKIDNEKERYGKFKSVNGEKVKVTEAIPENVITNGKPQAKVQTEKNGKMPWQKF